MPEWLGIRNRPSASAAHRYTIDRHSVEVTSRLARVSAARGERYDDRHYTALLLAGLLHDVGKRPFVTDHAAEGARHAAVIMKRMGFDADIARWVRILVREHLTLSEFATGKNPNDPAVGESLARCVDRDPMLLDMLYDLTRADGSSLGLRPVRRYPSDTGGAIGAKVWCVPCTAPPVRVSGYRLKVAMPTLTSADTGLPAASRARTTTRSYGMYS